MDFISTNLPIFAEGVMVVVLITIPTAHLTEAWTMRTAMLGISEMSRRIVEAR
jgi:hypothetical protein